MQNLIFNDDLYRRSSDQDLETSTLKALVLGLSFYNNMYNTTFNKARADFYRMVPSFGYKREYKHLAPGVALLAVDSIARQESGGRNGRYWSGLPLDILLCSIIIVTAGTTKLPTK